MKKIFLSVVTALMSTLVCNAQDVISLPQPSNTAKMSLIDALNQRHSSREFSSKDIDDATLSQVLWAACGINRPGEQKITAPSAMNRQDIVVYVVRKDGAYRYNPADNTLQKVSADDLRPAVAGRQSFAAEAPVSLVLVSDQERLKSDNDTMSALDAGYVSQNICLICTALGLNTVPRITMDKDALSKALNLKPTDKLIANNPIGWAK